MGTDAEQMLSNILKTVFSIFNCDRAWLLYPCDPDAPSFRVIEEITRPEYPGAKVLNVDVPMSPGKSQNMREALESDEPVAYTAGTERPISTAKQFAVQSQMFIPIFPKMGNPWVFGMHQCSYPRVWSEEEIRLFKEIGRRVSDALSSVLFLRELKENEERFRAIFERSAVGMSQIAPDGKFLRINKAFADMLGYSMEELHQLNFEQITHPDDMATSQECIRTLMAGKQTSYRFDKRYIHKKGNIVWVDFSAALLRNEHGTPLYLIACIVDITERKLADEDNMKLQSQLLQAQKMEAIGTLAGGIAHDFNNILSAVIGYTELAQMKLESGSEIENDLKGVLTAGVRAKALVNQILLFSRQTQKEQMPVQMGLIVKEALKLIRSSLPVTIKICQNIQSQSIVLCDPTQLHQIVMNLCTNAAHAMRGKDGILEIVLTDVELDSDFCSSHAEIQPGAYQKLTVSDTGHGMTGDVMNQIFDPFFTTKPKGEGTGLGLSVVHSIVKNSRGTITAESYPDKGTTFNLYFPILKGRAEEKSEEHTILPTGTERILVVDDEEVLIDIITKILSFLGYAVETRTSSLEALEFFKAMPDRFDLVITDMTLPQMTGDKLAQELMKIRPHLPVILCTGFNENITREKAEAMGIRAFLIKPLLKEEMAHAIRKVPDEAKSNAQ